MMYWANGSKTTPHEKRDENNIQGRRHSRMISRDEMGENNSRCENNRRADRKFYGPKIVENDVPRQNTRK